MNIKAQQKECSENQVSIKIVGIYMLLGGLWIALSDGAVSLLFSDPKTISEISAIKGFLYIILTGILLYFLIKKNIKQLKDILARLKWSEEKFNSLADNIDSMFWFVDPETMDMVYLNKGFEKITGYKREYFYGSLRKWRSLLHIEDKDIMVNAFNKWMENGAKSSLRLNYRLNDITGNTKWIENNAVGIFDEDGKLVYVAGVIKDITDSVISNEESRKSAEQLREYAAHIQAAREDERLHIARELHDEIGQSLTSIKMDLIHFALKVKKNGLNLESMESQIRNITENIDLAVNTVRSLSSELRPSILDDLGLLPAIEWQINDISQKAGFKCKYVINADERKLSEKAKTQVFRIFQESLTNIVRHSQATFVSIDIIEENGYLKLTVADNGKGINPKDLNNPHYLGILGMKERAALLNGNLHITGKQDEGTKVVLTIPVN